MSIISRIIPHKKDNSLEMSSPDYKTLYGVKIKKLSIAKYIKVLKAADNLPTLIFGAAFPDAEGLPDLIKQVSDMDKTAMLKLVGRLLTVVPAEFCKILSDLLDIPEERLLNPDCEGALSLNELMEIILAFIELNDYSDFFTNVQSLKQTCQMIANRTQDATGSSGG